MASGAVSGWPVATVGRRVPARPSPATKKMRALGVELGSELGEARMGGVVRGKGDDGKAALDQRHRPVQQFGAGIGLCMDE